MRRSLVLARSVEQISPSDDFQARLLERLRTQPAATLRADDDGLAGDAAFLVTARGWQPSRRALAAVAASMVLMTTVAYLRAEPARERARIAAMTPLPDPIPVPPATLSPGFVGAVLAGNPVVPAAVMATQAPIEFLTGGVQPAVATYPMAPVLSGMR
ncbi:MAG: hypothetical protein MUE41_15890 [Gemmatimonadaceae bacterium]|nr:hypothetical protein [Gemmatimonadaceae bacterium]